MWLETKHLLRRRWRRDVTHVDVDHARARTAENSARCLLRPADRPAASRQPLAWLLTQTSSPRPQRRSSRSIADSHRYQREQVALRDRPLFLSRRGQNDRRRGHGRWTGRARTERSSRGQYQNACVLRRSSSTYVPVSLPFASTATRRHHVDVEPDLGRPIDPFDVSVFSLVKLLIQVALVRTSGRNTTGGSCD
jgi:hypothetical protein